ncbi:hypothetical protein [Actinoplanes derwentensis]|uniref:Uncharacterized protein n=1 Tax=Actinoplanes derwentensis TaxID=113562 RepID=A0A1H1Q0B0_9ACTN|nr:hypothetical protein [Actinoplanes derwentensis]GID82273.1 hypothetical protein Ade03nite_11970 [Actinoplanes derwentensis]SDS16840.1 hypothetical protein SAMN04489716_0168 [Actinoplanes derwentensis]
MTDTVDEPEDNTGGDYEYDEAHGGNDDGPDVPAALLQEAARHREMSPPA